MMSITRSMKCLAFVSVLVLFSTTRIAYAEVRPITFPVDGVHSFRDDFSEPRGDGTREHLGIDIISSKLTPIVAAVDGRITYIAMPEASWGYSITIQDDERYQYRYLHINNDTPGTDDGQGGVQNAYAPGLARGTRVTKGQLIGWVGDSGNAELTVSHLHFEMRDPSRKSINPYETLRAADTRPVLATTSTSMPIGIESEPAYSFAKTLTVGSRGEDVRHLQILLKAVGYYDYPEITGYYGPVTKASVIRFQKALGIDPIGIVGPMTRAALNGI